MNIEHHYSTKHAKMDQLKFEGSLDKVATLRRSLGSNKSVFEIVCQNAELQNDGLGK